MAYSVTSGTNTFIPNHEATGGLIVGFSRNPKDFAMNKYLEIRKVDRVAGYYLTLASQQPARITTSDIAKYVWADGNARPSGIDNLDKFTFVRYDTVRYDYPFTIGDMAQQQADWDPILVHAQSTAQEAMTARGLLSYATLSAASWGSNTSAVDGGLVAGGKNWTNGTDTTPYIKTSLNKAKIQVLKSTIGVVKPRMMKLVINPNTARAMAESQEIHSYLARSVFAYPNLAGDQALVDDYGLPPILYGHEVVVDDTVVITSKPNSSGTATYTFSVADGEAFFLSRVGGIEGPAGGPAFSTLTAFFYQDEMTVETLADPRNRRTEGHVVDNYQIQVTSPRSGYYFTTCLG